MIVIEGGYSIEQYPKQNKVVISLPQTMRSCTNTVENISERRDMLSESELSSIAFLTKTLFETYNLRPFQLEEQKNGGNT